MLTSLFASRKAARSGTGRVFIKDRNVDLQTRLRTVSPGGGFSRAAMLGDICFGAASTSTTILLVEGFLGGLDAEGKELFIGDFGKG